MCCDYGPFVELFRSGFTPQSFWFNQGSLAFPNITFFYCFFIFWYGFWEAQSPWILSWTSASVHHGGFIFVFFCIWRNRNGHTANSRNLLLFLFRNGTLADFLKIYLILNRYPKSVVVGPYHFVSKLAISGLPWYANNAKMFSLEGSHHISQCPPFNIHIIRWVMRW